MMRLRQLVFAISCSTLACAALGACQASGSDSAPGAGGDGNVAAAGDGNVAAAGAGGGACDVDESYMPLVDPADFVEGVDNPYWPLLPGTTFVFQGGGEYVEVTVSHATKEILGIPCVVVRDTVRDGAADAPIVEDTFDWYAQDKDGNVWYMGEDTKELDGDTVTSTAGSWQAGVNGAQPGIVMHATPPAAGKPYRQEYLACEAEDFAEIVSTSEAVSVPFGDYADCIETHEYTPLEPDLNELKYYCAGVGFVLEVDAETGDRIELTDVISP
jgi:hypothetical protein